MDNDSFFSMDRLVDFGLSMAMAHQMTKMMNQTIQDMHVPGAGNYMNTIQQPVLYYAMIDNAQAGPFTETELSQLINNKKISKETYIWKPGMKDWEMAQNLPEVLKLVCLIPPQFNK